MTVVSMVSSMISTCSEIIEETVTVNANLSVDGVDADVDDLLKSSLVGTLVPFFLTSTSMLLTSHGMKLLQWVDAQLFGELHRGLSSLSEHLQQLLKRLPRESLHSSRDARVCCGVDMF